MAKEKSLLSIREELAEAVGAWVIRSHAPEVLSGMGGDTTTDSIVFVRQGKPLYYTGPLDDEDHLLSHFVYNKESNVNSLTDSTFEVSNQ